MTITPESYMSSESLVKALHSTRRCAIRVDIHADGTWSHEQDALLIIPSQAEPFHHADRNRLRKIAEPTPIR